MNNKLVNKITNTKTRTLVIVAGSILVFGIIIALTSSGNAGEPLDKKQSTTSGVPQNVISTPGSRTTENYRKLQEEANLRGTKQAEKSTSTFIPTIVGNRRDQSEFKDKLNEALGSFDKAFKDTVNKGQQDASKYRGLSLASGLDARAQIDEKDKKQKNDIQKQRKAIQDKRIQEENQRRNIQINKDRAKQFDKVVAAMEAQRNMAMDDWNFVPAQRYKAGDYSASALDNNKGNSNGSGSGTDGKNSEELPIVLKAGSIIYGVIETSVSSDEPGPILAKVVVPPLKGARLIGEIKPAASPFVEKLQLAFNKVNIPSHPSTFGISAVAIDPDTARNAIATDVDHHYLERWGSLFAASFLEGYSKAVEDAGATTSISTQQSTGASTTQTNRPALSGKEQLFAGLSKVGESWSEILKKRVERPSTIYIEQGTGIGILITDDLRLGSEIVAINDEKDSSGQSNQAFQTLIPSFTLVQSSTQTDNTNQTTSTTQETN